MLAEQKQSFEAYQRVQAFLADNPLPPPDSYGAPGELLRDVVARLTAHATDQAAGGRLRRAETRRQRILKGVLRARHLRPIARIASALLQDAPGIERATRMPPTHITTTKLLAEAGAFREAVTPYEEIFVHKGGRPADFLARLDAAAEDLRQAQLGQAQNLAMQVGASAGIKDEIVRGRQAVEMLDSIVTTSFVENGEILAKWRSARRVREITGGNTSSSKPVGQTLTLVEAKVA